MSEELKSIEVGKLYKIVGLHKVDAFVFTPGAPIIIGSNIRITEIYQCPSYPGTFGPWGIIESTGHELDGQKVSLYAAYLELVKED